MNAKPVFTCFSTFFSYLLSMTPIFIHCTDWPTDVTELRLFHLALKLDQISIKRLITGHPWNTGHRGCTGCRHPYDQSGTSWYRNTFEEQIRRPSQSKSNQHLGHTGKGWTHKKVVSDWNVLNPDHLSRSPHECQSSPDAPSSHRV